MSARMWHWADLKKRKENEKEKTKNFLIDRWIYLLDRFVLMNMGKDVHLNNKWTKPTD